MTSKYRALTAKEIEQLIRQGCNCKDWSKLEVAEGFEAGRIKSTAFSGSIKLGAFDKEISLFGGISRPTGISNAVICNCVIGDNAYINNVGSYIANYVIEKEAVIENTDVIAVEGESSFGNGIDAAVINEAGGREVRIYDQLSAHIAYILSIYRHRPKLIANLQKIIDEYTTSVISSMGLIAQGARVVNCGEIKNVKIGPYCIIEGAKKLENGSINCSGEEPVYIGSNVIARNFILCSGARIDDAAMISDCFVGQGTILAKQFSADNSIFFSNCECLHGEACSIFAGPFTVTHHKATLLIAGLFSFFNAGSGANQSNHMYKLGPVHQGILERGCKTASSSHMYWPARVGAFTVVIGRHYTNPDISDLPFSYLIERDGEGVLIPGVNLCSTGTVRDANKWPERDKRRHAFAIDLINFNFLNPYIAQKMLNGCEILESLKATFGKQCEYCTYNGVKISRSSLEKGIDLYQLGINKFLGDCLIKRLGELQFKNEQQVYQRLLPETNIGQEKWVDLAGLIAPEQIIEELLGNIENGSVYTLDQLNQVLQLIHDNFNIYQWNWVVKVLEQRIGRKIENLKIKDILDFINEWKTSIQKYEEMFYADAQKEFSLTTQIGYGLDGDEVVKKSDFQAIRGSLEDNDFVCEIKRCIAGDIKNADSLISQMKKLQ